MNAITKVYRQKLRELDEGNGHPLINRSRVMENIVSLSQKIAAVDTPVLILGESGVGKDMLAKYIHNAGDRKKTGRLRQSELRGHTGNAARVAAVRL